MAPGTISGVENPEDRLRMERPPGGYRLPSPEGPGIAVEPPPSPGLQAFAFFFIVLVAGLLVLSFFSRPVMDLLARGFTAIGWPVLGPSFYVRRGWINAISTYPVAYLVQVIGTQLLFLGLAVAGALVLGRGVRDRLGLVRPRGGWRVLGLAVILEVLTFGFGIAAALALLPADYKTPDIQMRQLMMFREATTPVWLALLAAMSILPGISEEALFRGLIQRRLIAGWGVWGGILVTGLLFTFLHPPLVRSLILMPGCLWLGYVAWRCGSILPGIVLHAGTNAGVQGIVRFMPMDATSEDTITTTARLVAAGVAIASAGLAAWLLVLVHRWTRVTPPSTA